jgi:hypothetical protein
MPVISCSFNTDGNRQHRSRSYSSNTLLLEPTTFTMNRKASTSRAVSYSTKCNSEFPAKFSAKCRVKCASQLNPTAAPSWQRSVAPSQQPTSAPSLQRSASPSAQPSVAPSGSYDLFDLLCRRSSDQTACVRTSSILGRVSSLGERQLYHRNANI